jgi:tripeptide aminopeptidase
MTASTYQRVTRLAMMTAVHRAFYWLHLHQPQMRQWLLEAVRIPAPPFGESARAAWFLDQFRTLGLGNVHRDEEGNVLGEVASEGERHSPVILVSAHLDTVFPAGTPCDPIESSDSSRIRGAGVCDNAAGLSALLGLAAAIRFSNINPPATILFAANVGEEGEGDLRGMRHLFTVGRYKGRIAAAIALEGGGTATAVTNGLGSLRQRITLTGPGGHSWADAGAPNPILLLSSALHAIAEIPLSVEPLMTLNVGHISGGTSVNSIPSSATALVELRSTGSREIEDAAAEISRILQATIAPFTGLTSPVGLQIELIGRRPAACLPAGSQLLHTLVAVDRHLRIPTEQRLGSTDANLPLSLGVPALAIGTGGMGGNIHTLDEWYDPTGRETALRRVLLLILACGQIVPQLVQETAASTEAAVHSTP